MEVSALCLNGSAGIAKTLRVRPAFVEQFCIEDGFKGSSDELDNTRGAVQQLEVEQSCELCYRGFFFPPGRDCKYLKSGVVL